MHIKIIWTFLFSLFLFNPLMSQINPDWAVGYYGAYTYQPGIILKAEQLFEPIRVNKNKSMIKPYLGLELASYFHFQNNAYINSSLSGGLQRIGKKGRSFRLFASVGVLRAQNLIKSYRLNESGQLEDLGRKGNWGFFPGLGIGLGGPSTRNRGKKIIPYANFRLQMQTPYNDHFLLHPIFEIGTYFSSSKNRR
ncbi:MAG: hypothetical protein AAF696_38235 [Bacteroidota bacterium]